MEICLGIIFKDINIFLEAADIHTEEVCPVLWLLHKVDLALDLKNVRSLRN